MPHLLLFLAGPASSTSPPPLTQGQINPSTGQDSRAILARKLDFERVILKKIGALRAPVRKREDLLFGGEGAIFGYPKRNGFPGFPGFPLPQLVATPQKQTIVWFGGSDHSMV